MDTSLTPIIDDPRYWEVTIAGDLRIIVVTDAEDTPEDLGRAIANVTGKSVDVNPVTLEDLRA